MSLAGAVRPRAFNVTTFALAAFGGVASLVILGSFSKNDSASHAVIITLVLGCFLAAVALAGIGVLNAPWSLSTAVGAFPLALAVLVIAFAIVQVLRKAYSRASA